MKAFIHLGCRWMPEGTYYKAFKAEAEVVEGNASDLLRDLTIYRYALQKVVDALWDFDGLPKKSQLHQMFYPVLREYGFRAHVARNIYSYALALEDLEHLRESINGKNNGVRWRLKLFAYRKLQHAIIAKSIEYNVPILIIDPRNTSSTCPRCGSRLVYVHRLAICKTCKFKRDRDFVGAINIYLRGDVGKPWVFPQRGWNEE
ncbi:MAG: zinc ribbon domain-containing protein [Ignisphaera sp.]